MFNKFFLFTIVYILLCVSGNSATSAVQVIFFTVVDSADSIFVNGNISTTMNVVRGESVTDDTTTYGYRTGTKGSRRQITANLQQTLPEGLSLSVNLDPPPGGPVPTDQILSTMTAVVLSNIPLNANIVTGTYRIVYKLTATPSARIGFDNAVVVYTISES